MGQSQKSQKRRRKRSESSFLHDSAKLITKRIGARMTQPQLAAAAGLSKQLISDLERKRCSASLDSLGRIADALGCEIWDLIADSSDLLRRAS